MDQSAKDSTGIDYFDGQDDGVVAEEATLETLTKYAQELLSLQNEIDDATKGLAELNGRQNKISSVIIPELMDRLGMEEFKLTDGSKISVKKDIKCGLTEERKPAAFAWLRENDYGGIIKTAVSLSFGKGEEEMARAAVAALAEKGFHADAADSIHPATLKSFVKERIEAGDNIPLSDFGVFEFKQTKIALPRTRK